MVPALACPGASGPPPLLFLTQQVARGLCEEEQLFHLVLVRQLVPGRLLALQGRRPRAAHQPPATLWGRARREPAP